MDDETKLRRRVVEHQGRDLAIAVIAGLLVLGFVIFGVIQLSDRMTGHTLTGVITAKHFEPEPQTQITIGQQGLSKRKVAGEFTFEVYVESTERTYTVWVGQETFEAKSVGDRFQFPRPKETPATAEASPTP